MDSCPDEVILKICRHLSFNDVANLRRVNRRFAEIGAEALVTRVRFHVGQDSLERLGSIASHAVLCKYVDTVVFEGNILANVGCVHAYSHHYDADHHSNDKPQRPSIAASERELRLYERNLAKFQREVEQKYLRYRKLYESQQTLLNSDVYGGLIATSIPQFPKLRKVVLTTVGRCKHVLSQRFLNMFAMDCALPIEHDTRNTKEQLKVLMFPQGQALTTIRELEVHVLSPKFFTGFLPVTSLTQVFSNLKVIDLNFRLEKDDRNDMDLMTADRCYGKLSKGLLRDALKSAVGLRQLTINFDDFGYFGPCMNLKHVLGDTAWPELNFLDLDCMTTTQEYLLSALGRQPSLDKLTLGFFSLEDGRWAKATTLMRKDLHLSLFVAHGMLEDPDRMYPMHLIESECYMDDFVEFTLSNALDMYVTERDVDESEYHPLEDDSFADPEELREEYGPFLDSDDSDPMDCSD